MVLEEQGQTAKNEAAGLSVKDLFYKYIRFLPLFVICVALSLFVAYVYLRYATLVYQSTGTLVIKDDNNAAGSNDKLGQLLVSDDKKNIQNEIEYLQSRPLMERVVEALNLNYTYLAQGKIKELNVYKSCPFRVETFEIHDSAQAFTLGIEFEDENTFRINKENASFKFGQIFKNRNGVFRLVRNNTGQVGQEYRIQWQPTASVAEGLLSNLVVAPKQGTGILVISKQATSPQLAADVINQLMEEYKAAVIEDKNDATRKTIAFVDTRLAVVKHELDSINKRLLLFQQANDIIDPQAQSTNYLGRIEESSRQASEQIIQLNNAEMIGSYLQDQSLAYTPVPSSLGIGDPTLNGMIEGYNKAQLERKSLLENAPPGNVAVQQKGEEIEVLRQKILENLRTLKSAYRSAINAIQNKGGTAQSLVKTMPSKMQELADIKREQDTKLVIYNSLLQKKEESAIALASQISNTKVLQDAAVNQTPIKPNRRNTQLLAVVIGLVLPSLFIFILELLNDKVTTRNDIEKATSATILGEVGHSFGKDTLVVTNNSRKVVAEQFRILRSNLQYVLNHVSKPVILVTSSFSGEGKSFISTNVGAVMAVTGKKTIILEFDIRKPKILSQLGIAKRAGLTNYLLGKVKPEDLPVAVPGTENLFVLPCGPVPPNPSELLLDPKINELFDHLKNQFDVVIVDTAPVGMVSDAMTLGKFADCTLYIVRQGHTFKKQVVMIDEFYQTNKLPKISIVLNDVKLRSGYGYYGYGRYAYGYGHGSGYFEDEAPEPGFLGKWFGWLDTKNWSKKKKNKRTTV
jgi:capsular exopolysaccharide synthesis family protein